MKKSSIIFLVFSLLILAAGYVYFFVYNKEHPDFAELKPDFELEAKAFYDEFIADAATASQKFNGKMIALKGNAHRVEKVDSLTIAVFVFNEGMFGDEGVRCTFLQPVGDMINSADDIADYTIKGYCTGYNEVDVILEKCSLEKNK